NNTLPKAIATPAKSVPKYSAGTQAIDLTEMPRTNNAIAPNKVPPIPNRLVNNGVKVDTTPKAIKSKVVKSPNSELESPVSFRISSINGPTLANAGRKLIAIQRIPAIKRALVHFIRPSDSDFGIPSWEN